MLDPDSLPPLPDAKEQLRRYYAGAQMPSPDGGFLEPLAVRPRDDGTGVVVLECSASSIRYALAVPKATRTERKKVKEAVEAGQEPTCPRHGPDGLLKRTGPHLVCPSCGVRYAKV